MSWSITIDDVDEVTDAQRDILERFFHNLGADNPKYTTDARQLFDLVRTLGFVNCTLSGGRTPSPYGGADSIVLAVVGYDSRDVGRGVPKPEPGGASLYQRVRDTIAAGPDAPGDEELEVITAAPVEE